MSLDQNIPPMQIDSDPLDHPHVSPAVIRRLPRYFRYLRELIRQGKMRVSSGELSEMMNVTASQIRQDLNCFGGFGQQGYGYNVNYLYARICELLGVFARKTIPVTGTIYSLSQGYLISFLVFHVLKGYEYLGLEALLMTVAMVAAMSWLYSSGIVKADKKFHTVLLALVLGSFSMAFAADYEVEEIYISDIDGIAARILEAQDGI